jgi:hypothetical protein
MALQHVFLDTEEEAIRFYQIPPGYKPCYFNITEEPLSRNLAPTMNTEIDSETENVM